MGAPEEQQSAELERGRRIKVGLDRIRAEWQPFLGLLIAASRRSVLLSWVMARYLLDEEVAEIALDQKLRRGGAVARRIGKWACLRAEPPRP